MSSLQSILICYLAAINVVAYLLMWFDKYLAKTNGSRIPEGTLFLLAFLFGALGIYFGMRAPIYHKAGKRQFKWGIPTLLMINLILVMCFYKYLIPLSFHFLN